MNDKLCKNNNEGTQIMEEECYIKYHCCKSNAVFGLFLAKTL